MNGGLPRHLDSTLSRLRRTLVQWVTPRHPHGHDDGATRSQLADFKRALDHAAIVAITDVSGRISYVNDTFCEISGYSREELIGQDHRIINSGSHPQESFASCGGRSRRDGYGKARFAIAPKMVTSTGWIRLSCPF